MSVNEDYSRFQMALRKVLQVSKAELAQRLAEDKASKDGKPRRGPKPKVSSHAVSDKG